MANLPKHDDSPEMVAAPAALVAHAPRSPGRPWHLLDAHSEAVATRAETSLERIVDGRWGRLAGLWHDLGKGAPEWQAFIRAAGEAAQEAHVEEAGERRQGPPHSATGALHSRRALPETIAAPLAFAIAGHHGGIPDKERLRERLKLPEEIQRYARAITAQVDDPNKAGTPSIPPWILSPGSPKAGARGLEFFTRILFSALTDADFLDTEAYFALAGDVEAANRNAARAVGWPELRSYQPVLDAFLAAKGASASPTPVNLLRAEVLDACRAAGAGPRGAFSLTVPTGGGKTLSGLAFALGHAGAHNLRRVIIALPFTSIIEQTSEVLRDVFASLDQEVVLEHHSALDPDRATALGRVAAENWDAPLIVTTQVQLFESLFANRSGPCRKLHNLIDSVLVLDEVQSLPSNLLEPILDVVDELVRHYGVTVLLMTATQPALHRRQIGAREFPGLATPPREIIPEGLATRLWDGLRRVEVHWPTAWNVDASKEPDSFWSELASKLAENPQALAITHLKKDAQALWQALARLDPAAFHLSAAMCPAHRSQVLAEVKRRLKAGEGCRLVSTQVVEAGVDIDFPVVFRAMAGLESLAQSAGRCNREGTRPKGDFFVYEAPTSPPRSLRLHKDVAQTMLDATPDLDIFEPSTFQSYFSRLYSHKELDLPGVQPMRAALNFQETAASFRMIEEASTTVFVPFDDRATSALKVLRFAGPSRDRLRLLQRYGVSVYANQFKSLQAEGAIEELHTGLWSLCSDPNYDKNLGLRTSADASVALIF
jgi:CRISPR-associated endonuclease/helicase Cas3